MGTTPTSPAEPTGLESPALIRSPKLRLAYVDFLRLLASMQMIQGHAIDALLAAEFRHGLGFAFWSWGRGLTAVGFLFASGSAYYATTLRSLDTYLADSTKRFKRYRRGLLLLAIGYALHLPAHLGSSDLAARWQSIRSFLAVDVLQCIGMTLILVETLVRTGLSRRALGFVCGVLGALFLVSAPWVTALNGPDYLLPLVNFVSRQNGSLFPLFPWAGFMLLGIFLSEVAVGEYALPKVIGFRLISFGALLIGLGYLVEWGFDSRTARSAFYDPTYGIGSSLRKLGWVTAIAGALNGLAPLHPKLPAWMKTLTGETLVLYVVHLLIIYNQGAGLVHHFGRTLSPISAAAIAVILMVVSTIFALVWNRIKSLRTRRKEPLAKTPT